MALSTVTIRVDDTLKNNFNSLCGQFGLSNTAAYILFMKAVVRERRIPFDIRIDSDEEIRTKAVNAFAQMRADAARRNMRDLSVDEINKIINEVRDGK
ncbi:MAG: type II toxin-antitoxin system RelB/DinJ family antitoxin [Bacteroidales bacterium]|nr:type II toxin-antitoxin system RelB/DinJ family antitoxin [Candidatus Cacconaster equi]